MSVGFVLSASIVLLIEETLFNGRPFLAEDCHPPQLIEGLLWRKPTLKSHLSAAETDP